MKSIIINIFEFSKKFRAFILVRNYYTKINARMLQGNINTLNNDLHRQSTKGKGLTLRKYHKLKMLAGAAIKRGYFQIQRNDVELGRDVLKYVEVYSIMLRDFSACIECHKAQVSLGDFNDAKTRLEYLINEKNFLDPAMAELVFDLYLDKYLERMNSENKVNYNVLKRVRLETFEHIKNDQTCKEEVCIEPYFFIKNGCLEKLIPPAYKKNIEHIVYTVSDALVDDTFSILANNGKSFVIYDKAGDPARGFVAGLSHRYYGSGVRLDNILRKADIEEKYAFEIEEAIHIIGRVPRNLFHLLIEYIPRYLSILKSDLNNRSIPILVPHGVPYQFYKIMRYFFGVETKFIAIENEQIVKVKKLYVPTFGSELDDSSYVDLLKCGLYSKYYMSYLRDTLLNIDISGISVPERVFLARSSDSARGLINENQVRAFAVKNGFKLIVPSELSIEQQVAIFRKSNIIMGVAGAAFSWCLVAGKHTRIISFVADENEKYSIQPQLAKIGDAHHIFVCGKRHLNKDLFTDRLSYFHSPFSIRIDDIKLALSQQREIK